eukprot:5448659-Pyramimonas_sp.AAC.1
MKPTNKRGGLDAVWWYRYTSAQRGGTGVLRPRPVTAVKRVPVVKGPPTKAAARGGLPSARSLFLTIVRVPAAGTLPCHGGLGNAARYHVRTTWRGTCGPAVGELLGCREPRAPFTVEGM